MGIDCCFQGRPVLERVRNLSISCLVLDSIFLLVDGLTALNSTGASAKTECYEAQGYIWRNVLILTFSISAAVALAGVMVHSAVACNTQAELRQIHFVTRYANGLVGWTFVSAIAETISYHNEPYECSDAYTSSSQDQDVATQQQNNLIWEFLYTVLAIAWVITAVAAGIVARRVVANPAELCAPPQSPAAPQTVGVPTGVDMPVGLEGGSGGRAIFGSVPGGASWQEGAVVGGVVVAQGRPVSNPEPCPTATAAPKTVD
mmetsp:Transcript_27290/g.78577  ORF Transcript_27290/g.78577 Transcript_27290/m.78577 type:complete len:260 (-) Transcript_27290:11-790(-)